MALLREIPGVPTDFNRFRRSRAVVRRPRRGVWWTCCFSGSYSMLLFGAVSVFLCLALLIGLYGYLPGGLGSTTECYDCAVIPAWRQSPDHLPCGVCSGHYCVKTETALGTAVSVEKRCGYGAPLAPESCQTRSWESGVHQHRCHCTGNLCNHGSALQPAVGFMIGVIVFVVWW